MVTSPGRARRRRWILPAVLALAVLAGGLLFVNRRHVLPTPEQCHFATAAGEMVLEPEEASNAAVITAVAHSRRLPERAVTIALATALQESHLKNLEGGDRDSVGLFQQRPSQGWGTAKQIADPVYTTNKFFDGLVKVPGYSRLPLTEAAQAVQKSGFPQAYAKHETDATVIAGALSGREAASMGCTVTSAAPVAAASPQTGKDGLTEGARRVSAQVKRDFARTVAVRTVPSGDGRALELVPAGKAAAGASSGTAGRDGWVVAHWAVARAAELGITSVVYDGQEWRTGSSTGGWQPYRGTAAPAAGGVLVTAGG
ncbi:hypothetical protein [Peterkaempfera bronchialis]|uniref:ARB-07466-like C-terminal domain-containing protein n=1 Tax=Peterkaempfera bronchialis TaxID=2126346 RepID=A0A345T6B9_9ACTN|nr:hypothetical protein [Peterkaempfera bronchialis]AXI81524.1 hypothetical protein C7M71_019620 [Peterkaempfera bronchialis]